MQLYNFYFFFYSSDDKKKFFKKIFCYADEYRFLKLYLVPVNKKEDES